MIVVGIDCAGQVAGVCIMQNETVLWQRSLHQGLTHSETLLPLMDTALQETKLTLAKINCFGITAGPGSFTGLRIGMALVKGLCLPTGIPVAPVSTLKALAQGSGLQGNIVSALNARRGEVYWAGFCMQGTVLKRLTPDAAAPAESLWPFLQSLTAPVYFIGDGACICYEAFASRLVCEVPENAALANTCKGVAQLAHNPAALLDASLLRPEYLRLSQAERERMQKLEINKEG